MDSALDKFLDTNTQVITSYSKKLFKQRVKGLIKEGWKVKEMTSRYCRGLFNGKTRYAAELDRAGV